ncbi:MAG TPA: hypothetical protein VH414_09700 [Lichenihabitans sp.]|jgi:hypothetical protein|nr:hypothetical protein [Lichenihabitans sp.]
MADKIAADVVPGLPAMRERLHVKVESATIDGVKVNIVTPDDIPAANRDKVVVHVHDGCYVYFPGESGTTEAIMMAGFGHYNGGHHQDRRFLLRQRIRRQRPGLAQRLLRRCGGLLCPRP